MKKLGIVAIALVIGTSMAVASSISIPWFIDNAPEANKVPGINPGVMTLVTLKSQVGGDPLECSIEYYASDGTALGAKNPDVNLPVGQNTFTISAFSALQFRPVQTDPSAVTIDPRTGGNGAAGGQEGAQGVLVPDRPLDVDPKANGSATISWVGEPHYVGGQVTVIQTTADGGLIPYAHLLGAAA